MSGTNLKPWPEQGEPTISGPRRSSRKRSSGVVVYRQVVAANGSGTTPGRVYKGMRMAGHMGDRRATIKKLRVVRADPERNLLLVKGSLPGARNALIFVKKA